ncbi:hypothetical protein PILCRDRAFT_809953 [Piloderma croceum F 1598]|uniref:Secreted protein n=1 Tax=Piloderma croceum (strain F 1598) TaxID=765440 RepID=A0A0C3GN50_PILCF|nr:hypothetical protein PILCRDRAFT_809953 [Piloderma croceum F 1598]
MVLFPYPAYCLAPFPSLLLLFPSYSSANYISATTPSPLRQPGPPIIAQRRLCQLPNNKLTYRV